MNEDEHTREVYAHFGLAVYQAQVLEHGLVNAMVILRIPERNRVTRIDIDDFMGQEFQKTLGNLIHDLKKYTTLPSELEDLLSSALKTRNWLCHHYFRERAEDFMTSSGKSGMIIELDDSCHLLIKADRALNALTRPLAAQFGITEAAIDAEVEAMLLTLTA